MSAGRKSRATIDRRDLSFGACVTLFYVKASLGITQLQEM